eukprot:994550-Pyramimonas_sp.AAC.1
MVFRLGDATSACRASGTTTWVLGQDPGAVRGALDEKVAAFNKLRLDIHEVELFESKGAALGAVVDCERLCAAIAGKRRCRLEGSGLRLAAGRALAGIWSASWATAPAPAW